VQEYSRAKRYQENNAHKCVGGEKGRIQLPKIVSSYQSVLMQK
jgi:hypothetical protein